MEIIRGNFIISTDKSKLQIDIIHKYLSEESYWAKNISKERVQRSIEHAICFGVYDGEKQIGFARIVTDYAIIAYLGDVFILEPYRGKGLSKWLMECIVAHPDLTDLRRFVLATLDAHGLYEQFDFNPLHYPERWMERVNHKNYVDGKWLS